MANHLIRLTAGPVLAHRACGSFVTQLPPDQEATQKTARKHNVAFLRLHFKVWSPQTPAGEGSAMTKRKSYPATFLKACHVKFAVFILGWTQTQAAIAVGLNSGTVSKIINGLRFPGSKPLPF